MKENSSTSLELPTNPRRNSVIQAAAGTGKTWMLTSRLIRLLLAGAAPATVLAITFTRKAAAEMHLRLRGRLYALCVADETERKRLLQETGATGTPDEMERARRLYEELLVAPHELRATTFHAFCQELLARFPLEAGVAPGFTLTEHTGELERAAFRALDRDLAEQGTSLDQAMDVLLAECGGLTNVWRALREFLNHRSDWWAYTENQADAAGYATRELLRVLALADERDPREAFAADAAMRGALEAYLTGFNGEAAGKHDAALACLRQALAPETTPDQFLRLLQKSFLTDKGEPRVFKPIKALAQALGADRMQRQLEQHARLLDRVQAAIEQCRRYRTFSRTRAWYVTGQRLLGHFQRLKREQDLLDFADLEWLTYRLISSGRHAEWVQYKLDQRIDHLLVDEFQDTNPTQWRLLLPLLQEMAAGGSERRRSVFLVGDEKQSIYRFRRADPALLGLARDWLHTHTGAQIYEQHISWRSSSAIIEFVNGVFDKPASGTSAIDFDLHEFRTHATHKRDLWGRAELLPLIPPDETAAAAAAAFRNPLKAPRVLEEDQRHRREGRLIAATVQKLLGQPIEDHGGVRALGYGDVLILLRDRTHAGLYEAALRDAHIPYAGAGRGTFLDCLEVRDIVQLLTLLITPFDDLALATVLRSPVFAASDGDLIALAGHTEGDTWYQRLRSLAINAATDAPIARAAHLLDGWRAVADRIPVHDLLDRIYFEADVPERYRSAAPAHLKARVAANLVRLLELALEVDSGRFPSLARFLARLEALTQEENESLGTAVGNQVRLLTIHAAKGLESPVVFLADSARSTFAARERGVRALIEWPMETERPTLFLLAGNRAEADPVSRDALGRQADVARREEANLLYVALTRAKQMLYVSGCESGTRLRTARQAGDAGRGWYGFIERRLQVAAARIETLRLERISHAESAEAYNVCGVVTHGSVPAVIAAAAASTGGSTPIDPRLTRPFMATPGRSVVLPSGAVRHGAGSALSPDAHEHAARSEAKERGVVIHRMLERLAVPAETRAKTRERIWRELGYRLPEATLEDCWQEACALVDAPEHRALFDAGEPQEARNEVPILYRWNNTDVTGVIDRLLIRERELILIDYKTDRAAPGEIEALVATYAPQLKLYVEGLRKLWPDKIVEALLLFTALRRAVSVNL